MTDLLTLWENGQVQELRSELADLLPDLAMNDDFWTTPVDELLVEVGVL